MRSQSSKNIWYSNYLKKIPWREHKQLYCVYQLIVELKLIDTDRQHPIMRRPSVLLLSPRSPLYQCVWVPGKTLPFLLMMHPSGDNRRRYWWIGGCISGPDMTYQHRSYSRYHSHQCLSVPFNPLLSSKWCICLLMASSDINRLHLAISLGRASYSTICRLLY